MDKPFSIRNAPPHDSLQYDITPKAKNRVLHAIGHLIERHKGTYRGRHSKISSGRLLESIGKNVLRHDGSLLVPHGPRLYESTVIDHFMECGLEKSLDFIEHLVAFASGIQGSLVAEINEIFLEEGIGFELIKRNTASYIIIRKDSEYLHREVVRPCLESLATPGFEVASAEMLKAHEAYRHCQYADAITDAGSSFESVLKTICTMKRWEYDAERATCSSLVKTCKDNGLFPAFYAPMLEAVGTLRNKLSDAHGRGPEPIVTAGKDHADHMVQLTSTHITFLIRQAI